jgi:hypothetical protein
MKVGDTIELVSMPDDPDAIPVGTKGVIKSISKIPMQPPFTQLVVDWENGRTLNVVIPPDVVRVVA